MGMDRPRSWRSPASRALSASCFQRRANDSASSATQRTCSKRDVFAHRRGEQTVAVLADGEAMTDFCRRDVGHAAVDPREEGGNFCIRPGANGGPPAGQGLELRWVLPAGEGRRRVGAGDEMQFGVRMTFLEKRESVDGV